MRVHIGQLQKIGFPRCEQAVVDQMCIRDSCECIASLLGEVDEVLVVDIGSFDKTMERVRALSIPGVRLEKYRAMDCPDLNIFIRGLLSPGWAFYVGHNERLSGNRELPLKSLVNGFNGLSCPESICLCPSGWSGEETCLLYTSTKLSCSL